MLSERNIPYLVFLHLRCRHDAEEVVEIMRDTMIDVFHDGLGHLDFSRSANGSGMSSRGMSKKFLAALERASRMQQRNVFFVNELKQVRKNTEIIHKMFKVFAEDNNKKILVQHLHHLVSDPSYNSCDALPQHII